MESEIMLFVLITLFECQQNQHSMKEAQDRLLQMNDMQQKVEFNGETFLTTMGAYNSYILPRLCDKIV